MNSNPYSLNSMTNKMANNIEKIKNSATHKVNNSAPSTESRYVPNLPSSNPFSMNALTKKKAKNLNRIKITTGSRINSRSPSPSSRHVSNLPSSNPYSMNALIKKKANNLKRVTTSATSRTNSGRRVAVGGKRKTKSRKYTNRKYKKTRRNRR